MEGTRHRLTVAVEVAEPARAALAQVVRPLRAGQPGLRWTDPECWHIALAFLGGVTTEQAEKIDAAVSEIAERFAPFPLRLDGGAGMIRNRMLYAGVEESGALHGLHREVVERLAVAGFVVDAFDFLPHNAIVRAPIGARLPPGLLGAFHGPSVTWTVRRLVVLRSRLRLGGVTYEIRSGHRFAATGRIAR
jgi:2'-5' RNA ligase